MPNRGRFYNITKKTGLFFIMIAMVFVFSGIYPPAEKVDAAGINNITVALGDSTGDNCATPVEAASAEAVVCVTWTPPAALAGAFTIYVGEDTSGVEFTDGDADQTTADVSCTQSGTTFNTPTYTAASPTEPMKFGMTVATGGNTNSITCNMGTSSTDAPENPATADVYSVAVIAGVDSGAGPVYVGNTNDVNVSVTVLSNLTLLIDSPDNTYCTTTSGVTSCDLGTVLTTTTVPTANYDVNIGTNAASGATLWIAEDTDLGTIADCTLGDVVTPGTEDYGGTVTNNGMTMIAPWTNANCIPFEATEQVASVAGPTDRTTGSDVNIQHEVAIDSTTAAGSHSHTVTWTVVGSF